VSTEQDDPIAYLTGEGGQSLPADQRRDLDELRAMLEDPAVWEEPGEGLEASIVQAIGEEARHRRPQPATAWWRAIRPPGWLHPPRAVAAVVAAAAVVALIVVLSLPGAGPAPERFAMVVSGTAVAPEAHGNATLTKQKSGWIISLSATGLPRLSGSRYYYQAWVRNRAGILVPVGTFNDARQVTLWSGVPITQYRTLTVTIQPANGNPASSHRQVLIGTITSAG
jgi:Anti-sigma-K factor rskA